MVANLIPYINGNQVSFDVLGTGGQAWDIVIESRLVNRGFPGQNCPYYVEIISGVGDTIISPTPWKSYIDDSYCALLFIGNNSTPDDAEYYYVNVRNVQVTIGVTCSSCYINVYRNGQYLNDTRYWTDYLFVDGDVIKLEAIPMAGYRFKEWFVSDVSYSTMNPLSWTVVGGYNIRGTFEPEVPTCNTPSVSTIIP